MNNIKKNLLKGIHVVFITIVMVLSSCSGHYDSDEGHYEEWGSYDGDYCAEVEYYNPNTGTRSTYTLNIYVEEDELVEIYWPNGGWLDQDHFWSTDISSGYCEFVSDNGYEYSVVIIGESCGWTDESLISRQWEDDRNAITCPRCGDEKDSYDDYCYSCEREIKDEVENTCGRCGRYEYAVYGSLCSYCQDDDESDYW